MLSNMLLIMLLLLVNSVAGENVRLELMSWGTPLAQELQVPDPTTDNPSFVLLLVNNEFSTSDRQVGRFSVRAPRGHGLMAVLQIVSLRKNANGCRDFIKLSDPTSGLFTSTPNICGFLNKENKSFVPNDLVGPRTFHSAGGKMEVYYESDVVAQERANQVVEIVFTGYSDCLIESFANQLKCGEKCIPASLSCDTHLNCAFQEDFGVDEMNCTYPLSIGSKKRYGFGDGQKSNYLVSLYLGAFVFLVILVGVGWYHRHTTYMRIKNIPT